MEVNNVTVDPITESLKRLVKYFEKNNIPYVVVGGISVFVLGRSRLTMDIDIILDHTKLSRENFVNYLKENNFDASLNDFEGFDEKTHCSFFYKTGMFRIDMKGIYSDLDQESIIMAIIGNYNGINLKINHPLNLVLFKLKFGSEQDYEDALAVYIRQKEKINLNLLKEKAKRMNISSTVDLFLKEIKEFLDKQKNSS